MRTALHLSLAWLVVLLTGCGSINSRWEGNRKPYVGVKTDAAAVKSASTEWEFIPAFDIPLSAIMDTFFLPYDLARGDNTKPQNAHAQEVSAAPAPAPSLAPAPVERRSDPSRISGGGTDRP
ncbi:MAG TPA: YceK/YidQ family lipoprotein [Candidatus Limnocylindria bacterium]|nr:YceK/YidQ family lipoprotein [Candidatus Limnocylindria bacterium]